MSYWNTKSSIANLSQINESGFKQGTSGGTLSEFFEIEEAVVLDVIYDENHPELSLIHI